MSKRFSVEAIFTLADKVSAPIAKISKRLTRFTFRLRKSLKRLNAALDSTIGFLRKATSTAVKFAAVGLGGVAAGVGFVLREFSKVENAQAAFQPILGGVEKAKEAVELLNQAAAKTPFQFETLSGAARQLLPVVKGGMGEVVDIIKTLGDTAGGNAQKLDSIVRGYTKAMLKGKTDMESLNMIAEAGVPIFTELADAVGGKVGPAFFKAISAGKITTAQLTKAFKKMTSEGGIFYNGMEIASNTLSGLFSTLKDNVGWTAAALGEVLAPTVKELLRGAIAASQRMREWVKANRELISEKFIKFVDKAGAAFESVSSSLAKLNARADIIERLGDIVIGASDAFRYLSEHGTTILRLVGALVMLSIATKALSLVVGVFSAGLAIFNAGLKAWLFITKMLPKALALARVAMLALNIAMTANPVGLIVKGVALLIGLAGTLVAAWDPVSEFFSSMFDKVSNFVAPITRLFGFGGGDGESEGAAAGAPGSLVASPQERTAKTIEESRHTGKATLNIVGAGDNATLSNASPVPGIDLQLAASGEF